MTDRKTWKERIEQAKKSGSFTIEDKARSAAFSTCAVGERGLREVGEAYDLGMAFYHEIYGDNIAEVEHIYNLIQKLPKASPKKKREPT